MYVTDYKPNFSDRLTGDSLRLPSRFQIMISLLSSEGGRTGLELPGMGDSTTPVHVYRRSFWVKIGFKF